MTQHSIGPGGQKRYSYILRPIGAYLDLLEARNVTVAEIEDGFLWHCYRLGRPLQAVTGVFSLAEIPDLIESIKQRKAEAARAEDAEQRARKHGLGLFRRQEQAPVVERPVHPLMPSGYEETLRSIGARVEDQRACALMLAERPASLLVIYSLPLPNYIRLDVTRMEAYSGMHEVEYSRDELLEIITSVRARRGLRYYQHQG
jgi:hypothetical protein